MDALDTLYAFDKDLSRQFVYASMLADQDTRDSAHQGMRQEMSRNHGRDGEAAGVASLDGATMMGPPPGTFTGAGGLFVGVQPPFVG